jgi:hypothetical protein
VPKAQGLRVTRPALAERGRAYDDLIGEHSRTQGVRPGLVRAVMQVESGFDPFARSPKGAMGLMQLMPATAKQYAKKIKLPYSPKLLVNPEANIRMGTAYLADKIREFGDLHLVLAIPPTGSISKAIQLLKGSSSRWIRQRFPERRVLAEVANRDAILGFDESFQDIRQLTAETLELDIVRGKDRKFIRFSLGRQKVPHTSRLVRTSQGHQWACCCRRHL